MVVRIPFSQFARFASALHGFHGDSSAGYPELTEGSSGPYVNELQARLNKVGASIGGDPTGNYGAETTQAVKNFQAAYGLDKTGNATIAVWDKLIEVTPDIPTADVRKTGAAPVYIAPAAKAGKILGMPIPVAIVGGATLAFVAALVLAKLAGGRRAPAMAGYRRRRYRR